MKEWAKSFYKSKAWKKCRESFLISKFNICERCNAAAFIVHHKIYLNPNNINDASVTLNWSNLEALCQECHNKEHMSKDITVDECIFDDEGNLVLKSPPIKASIYADGDRGVALQKTEH